LSSAGKWLLPGMPNDSAGMTGQKTALFTIYSVTKNGAAAAVYAVE